MVDDPDIERHSSISGVGWWKPEEVDNKHNDSISGVEGSGCQRSSKTSTAAQFQELSMVVEARQVRTPPKSSRHAGFWDCRPLLAMRLELGQSMGSE